MPCIFLVLSADSWRRGVPWLLPQLFQSHHLPGTAQKKRRLCRIWKGTALLNMILGVLWITLSPVTTAIKNVLHFHCGDRLKTSESDVYRRQILTSNVGPRAERGNTQEAILVYFAVGMQFKVCSFTLFACTLFFTTWNSCPPNNIILSSIIWLVTFSSVNEPVVMLNCHDNIMIY